MVEMIHSKRERQKRLNEDTKTRKKERKRHITRNKYKKEKKMLFLLNQPNSFYILVFVEYPR